MSATALGETVVCAAAHTHIHMLLSEETESIHLHTGRNNARSRASARLLKVLRNKVLEWSVSIMNSEVSLFAIFCL